LVDWESTGGRGLLLVEAMSTTWGSVPVSGGKQVWSEVVVAHRLDGTDGTGGPDGTGGESGGAVGRVDGRVDGGAVDGAR
ncbi:hypothetical protein AB4Z54_46100, partial [Streptomyces sp. MCAF7]